MRIAVASRDGKVINQHFGHAERFLIYEATPLNPPFGKGGQGGFKIRFVEERKVEKYCSGVEGHLYDDNRLERVYETIKDCSILLVSRIGHTPEMELSKRGIRIFIVYDLIEEGIQKAVNSSQ